jgi:hypothetical protein
MVSRFSRRFTTVWLRLSQYFCHRPGDDTDDVEGLRVPDEVKESLHDQDDVPGSLCTQDDVEGVPREPDNIEEHHHGQGDVEGSPGDDKANAPKLRALLTGISYKHSPSNPDGTKWDELDGTYSDVEQFRTLLLSGCCFRSFFNCRRHCPQRSSLSQKPTNTSQRTSSYLGMIPTSPVTLNQPRPTWSLSPTLHFARTYL